MTNQHVTDNIKDRPKLSFATKVQKNADTIVHQKQKKIFLVDE